MTTRYAPGWPGIPPRWTSSAKVGVGTALRATSRVWFTVSHGILNEVYYPRLDRACLRDLGLIVTDGLTFFSEEKRDATSRIAPLAPGVPGYHAVNSCRQGSYRIDKQIVADPLRDAVLQHTQFTSLNPSADHHVYVLVAPHLANHGWGNTAWLDMYKGVPMLFAERDGAALAVACDPPWRQRSAGFVGVSDGWQELSAHKQLVSCYERAENGNVALTGEVDLRAGNGTFLVALAFGNSAAEAGHRARATLLDGFERARSIYVHEWTVWQRRLDHLHSDRAGADLARMSAAVLRCHEEKRIPGAAIASLSIPWGAEKSDEDLGGYHLVWPRDLVEAAGGLLAVGADDDAVRVLEYLRATQEPDGSWPQNMWVDGEAYWHGIQLDEAGFPILLIDLLRRDEHLDLDQVRAYWPMVRNAAGFIVRHGPSTEQDRWEEDAGLSPFTLAVEIASLLVAADLADTCGEPDLARYLLETADAWNDDIEAGTYVTGTELSRRLGVDGYYVRIAPPEVADAASPVHGFVPIKNRPWPQANLEACELVSPDALALVRFGLRAPDDARILNTVRVIDALLKVDTPFGPVWRRYNGDGYGEHEDGHAFDGVGVGRPWPLLTGERAHYELAAGRPDVARDLLGTLEACANEGHMLPEQIWDGPAVPERELSFGRPSGSAMPLVWAHAEYLKLQRSLRDGRVYDLPRYTWQRYVIDRTTSRYAFWRFNHRRRTMQPGRILRVETLVPSLVHWSTDGWRTTHDTRAQDTGLGEYVIDLPTESLPPGTPIDFTFYWPDVDRWEQVNFRVEVQTSPLI
ncbi:MAG: glucan 1,4-alpha-glucosidase [Acidobacteria bacterium]|nr:MAG: glucan 1,4-alpha-glucosidase [Acidobacteriota bacterium]